MMWNYQKTIQTGISFLANDHAEWQFKTSQQRRFRMEEKKNEETTFTDDQAQRKASKGSSVNHMLPYVSDIRTLSSC